MTLERELVGESISPGQLRAVRCQTMLWTQGERVPGKDGSSATDPKVQGKAGSGFKERRPCIC